MNSSFKKALEWILDLVLVSIGTFLFGKVTELILGNVSLLGIFGVLVIIGATALTVYLLLAWRKESTTLDPRFIHLKVFYSDSHDTPDAKPPRHPYYVLNCNTKQAYYVPDLIVPFVRPHKFSWASYYDKEVLLAYFKEQGITPNNRDPSDEELGLWLKPNGSLVLAEPKLEPDLLERLEKRKLEGKLKDFQIAFLYPWYCWFLRFHFVEIKVYPPNRRLLANVRTKEAFVAPSTSMDLCNKEIVGHQPYTPRPWESISKWCKRKHGWTFKQRTFTVEELAGDHMVH